MKDQISLGSAIKPRAVRAGARPDCFSGLVGLAMADIHETPIVEFGISISPQLIEFVVPRIDQHAKSLSCDVDSTVVLPQP